MAGNGLLASWIYRRNGIWGHVPPRTRAWSNIPRGLPLSLWRPLAAVAPPARSSPSMARDPLAPQDPALSVSRHKFLLRRGLHSDTWAGGLSVARSSCLGLCGVAAVASRRVGTWRGRRRCRATMMRAQREGKGRELLSAALILNSYDLSHSANRLWIGVAVSAGRRLTRILAGGGQKIGRRTFAARAPFADPVA